MRKFRQTLGQLIIDNPVILTTFIVAIIMVFTVPQFATVRNWATITEQLSYIGVACVGLTFVIISGGNDLSIAANMTMISVISAIFSVWFHFGTVLSIVIALFIGVCAGALNGFLVSRFGISAFIVTLTTQLLFEGLALIFTDASTIVGLPQGYLAIAEARVLGIPMLVIIMIVFFVLGHILLHRSTYGRELIAVGSSKQAANLAGINVRRVQLIAFAISGFCGACAGIMMTSRIGGATSAVGATVISDIIAGTVIGGNSLSGGRGSIVGTLFGVFLVGLISNGINLMGIEYSVMLLIKGAIIVLALVTDAAKDGVMNRRLLRNT